MPDGIPKHRKLIATAATTEPAHLILCRKPGFGVSVLGLGFLGAFPSPLLLRHFVGALLRYLFADERGVWRFPSFFVAPSLSFPFSHFLFGFGFCGFPFRVRASK